MSRISAKLAQKIRHEAKNRCGYCLGEQKFILAWLELEHIVPLAKGGTSDKANLWLACPFCNGFKRSQTRGLDPVTRRKIALFNPRQQQWKKHFGFGSDKATIVGKTMCGRATVNALKVKNELALETRRHWVAVGWYPPPD